VTTETSRLRSSIVYSVQISSFYNNARGLALQQTVKQKHP